MSKALYSSSFVATYSPCRLPVAYKPIIPVAWSVGFPFDTSWQRFALENISGGI
jgi:hypothetical protein